MTELYQYPVPKGWHGFCLALTGYFHCKNHAKRVFANNGFKTVDNATNYEDQ